MNNAPWTEERIQPGVALALLESLRAADTPTEHLQDENVHQSLPRRLGLSAVVETQMHRYAALMRESGSLPAREVAELFRLVSRRPDARAVFTDTGRRLAGTDYSGRGHGMRPLARRLPSRLRCRLGLRGVYRIAKQLTPDGTVRVQVRPPGLIVTGGLLARVCRSDAGCQLLNAAFETSLEAFGAGQGSIDHPECEGRGDRQCVWRPLPG